MPVILRPAVLLEAGAETEHGRMAFVGKDLIATLIKVEGQNAQVPRWAIDWLAPAVNGSPPLFTQLESARIWLSHRYRTCLGRLDKRP
jgi:hypothetical protein